MHPASIRGIPWPMFRMEVYRLATFASYPQEAIKSPALLASEGFVYVRNGEDDAVVCFFCGTKKKNWNSRDVIEVVHRLLSPDCPRFIISTRHIDMPVSNSVAHNASLDVSDARSNYTLTSQERNQEGNYLLNATDQPNTLVSNVNSYSETSVASPTSIFASNLSDTLLAQSQQSQLLSSSCPLENQGPITTQDNVMSRSELPANSTSPVLPDSENEHGGQINSSSNVTSQLDSSNSTSERTTNSGRNPTYLELGIITDRPKRPEYALKIKRLQTFALWPRFHPITSEDLADAGFYYADSGDSTRCFYCGGGLRNWEDGDEVWVEHAKWFPRCSYLRRKMGAEFVDIVQELHLQNEQMSFADIKRRLDAQSSPLIIETEDSPMKRDPAVIAVLSLGYSEIDVLQAAQLIKQEWVSTVKLRRRRLRAAFCGSIQAVSKFQNNEPRVVKCGSC